MTENRRRYARFQTAQTPCRVEIRGQQSHAFQSDMSINGLGIVGLKLESLDFGEEIKIHLDDEDVDGICCSASRCSDGGFKIGVLRSRKHVRIDSSGKSLVERFIDCDGCEVPCEIVSSGSMFAIVRIRNGEMLKVPTDKMKSRTRDERAGYLRDENQLARFLDFYNVERKVTISGKENRALIDTVVNLEFGSFDSAGNESAGPETERPKSYRLTRRA